MFDAVLVPTSTGGRSFSSFATRWLPCGRPPREAGEGNTPPVFVFLPARKEDVLERLEQVCVQEAFRTATEASPRSSAPPARGVSPCWHSLAWLHHPPAFPVRCTPP